MKKLPIFRIPLGERIGRKKYLNEEEVKRLLDGEIIIEEKLDGKAVMNRIGEYEVYFEFMKWKHSIFYNKLPAWEILLDVVKDGRVLPYDFKLEFARKHGFHAAPLIYRGRINNLQELVRFLDRKSAFGEETIEGIVVKNYRNQVFGKLVRKEFYEGIEEHWLRKPKVMNRILKY